MSNFLNNLFIKAVSGNTINTDYQTWVLYTDEGGQAGVGYARQCTIQLNTKTAVAGEKRGFEFDLLPIGDVIKVNVGAETVGESDNEITVATTAASSS